MMRDSAQFYPKTRAPAPLAGSLQPEWKRCGKPTCRCARGELHGPYARRVWREGGQTQRQYVPLADVVEVDARCARYRALHMSRREFTRMVQDLARRSDAVIDALDAMQAGHLAGGVGDFTAVQQGGRRQ